jgi:AmmeMemoRadiSam system protein B
MGAIPDIRPSPIVGLWYSDDADQLARQVDQMLDDARPPEVRGRVVGLVAPHAGLKYSGRTAAYAFATVRGQSRPLVAVISPLHEYHPAPFLTSAHRAYQTPLGAVEIDLERLEHIDRQLRGSGHRPVTRVIADPEHSLEIELPFLQRALQGEFRLLPLMVRSRQLDELTALGRALADLLVNEDCLLVASTDLSHFYPEPVAQQLDSAMLTQIERFNPAGVLQVQDAGKGFACGTGAIVTVLTAARLLGANAVRLLHHSTSADETGDTGSVVGYGAAAIYQRDPD